MQWHDYAVLGTLIPLAWKLTRAFREARLTMAEAKQGGLLRLEKQKEKINPAVWDPEPEVYLSHVPLMLFGILGRDTCHIETLRAFCLYKELRDHQTTTLINYLRNKNQTICIKLPDGSSRPVAVIEGEGALVRFTYPLCKDEKQRAKANLHDELASCMGELGHVHAGAQPQAASGF